MRQRLPSKPPHRRRDRGRKRANIAAIGLEPLERRVLLSLQGNQLFPADNPWNQRITDAPVAADSATLIASIGAAKGLHPDFGSGLYNGSIIGIPYNVVSGTQPAVNVIIDAYPTESDHVPVPIPEGAVIEGDPASSAGAGGDRHLIVYDKDNNIAYELFAAYPPSQEPDNQWHASAEAVWDMSKNSFRRPGDTSADAAGLPILPGLVRPDEVFDQGVINHALRFTVPRTQDNWIFPASHEAGVDDPTLPRMGERFRLKASFDISGFSAPDRVILQALKDYGMIVADNGSSWFLSGEPSSRWDNIDLHELTQVIGSNFEAVDLAPAVSGLGQNSGPVGGGTMVTVHGKGFSGAAGKLQVFFGAAPAGGVTILSDTTLTAIAPAHTAAAVDVTVSSPYGISPVTPADQFIFSPTLPSTVVTHKIFYNHSYWNDPTNGFTDDDAIDTSKSALTNGQTATFANYTGASLGITGIMIDINGLPAGTPTTDDFTFKVGNDSSPGAWVDAAALPAVSVRRAKGDNGSDRVELIWSGNTIQNTWLQVTVKADPATGLASPDVFYFGSQIGETGDDPTNTFVNGTDFVRVRDNPANFLNRAQPDNPYDFNHDSFVDGTDLVITRDNANSFLNALKLISPPSGSAPATPGAISSVPRLAATVRSYSAPGVFTPYSAFVLGKAPRRKHDAPVFSSL